MASFRILLGALSGAMLAAGTSAALGQSNWPTRSVQVISPFTAGNASDLIGRITLEQVSKQVGQPFVIENRPGGGGTLGVAAVAKAEPDGYTILLHSSSFSSALVHHRTLPYDTLKDFTPVIPIGIQPVVLIIAPSKGYKTVAELVAAAKANPGAMNYASAGIGSTSHMAAERFRHAAGFKAQHVPFRGGPAALTEVMTGRVDFMTIGTGSGLPLINDGKLIPLAVTTQKRSAALPNVPTTLELGYQDSDYTFWNGFLAPAKTPKPVIARLHAEISKIVSSADMKEKLAKQGVEPLPLSPDEFDALMRKEIAGNLALAKAAGLKFN